MPPACGTSTSAWIPCARKRYREITGQDHFGDVMAGLELAETLGFHPIKINCVVLKTSTTNELLDFALLTRGSILSRCVSSSSCPRWNEARWRRTSCPWPKSAGGWPGWGPCKPSPPGHRRPRPDLQVAGVCRRVGFHQLRQRSSLPTCNRLRLNAAGWLRPCLFAAPELDLKTPLRQGASDATLARLFREAIRLKGCVSPGAALPLPRAMVSIGG